MASLISVPFQNNTDVGIGPLNGTKNTMNLQPVVPLSLTKSLNLITRVILPIVTQRDITGAGITQSGLSNVVASAFISPKEAKNGLTWGFGPTALVLKQTHGWTIGGLMNQLWSFACDKNRNDISQLFLQPFLTYNWKSGAGLGVSGEITQNWNTGNTGAYIIPTISGVPKIGTQTVQLAIGPRFQVAAQVGNKASMGIRAAVTFVFPK